MTYERIDQKLLARAHRSICRKNGNPTYAPTSDEIQAEIAMFAARDLALAQSVIKTAYEIAKAFK
jgi:hypothetical protein